jgi:hypothetical protein
MKTASIIAMPAEIRSANFQITRVLRCCYTNLFGPVGGHVCPSVYLVMTVRVSCLQAGGDMWYQCM